MPIYQIAGLTWVSDCDFSLLTEYGGIPQETIQFLMAPTGTRYPLPPVQPAGVIADGGDTIVASYQLNDGSYLLRWRFFDFLIDGQGRSVVCYAEHGAPDQVVWLLLSGLVASFVLMLQGTLAIHASGVVLDQSAACFIGFPGSGKSTIAAALSRGGCHWLADDTVAIDLSDDDAIVRPSHPTLKLREDAAEHFQLFRRVTIKEEVTITTAGLLAATGLHRLRTVYRLHCHRDLLQPAIKPIHGASRVVELLPHVRTAALAPPSLRRGLFDCCSRLVRTVRFAEFHYPYGLDNLSAIQEFLLEDIGGIHP